MISLENDPEPGRYIYTLNGVPHVGSLSEWAALWEASQYGADVSLSDTVLTWDDTSDPITWKVKVQRWSQDENDFIQYKITLPGHAAKEVSWVALDGRS